MDTEAYDDHTILYILLDNTKRIEESLEKLNKKLDTETKELDKRVKCCETFKQVIEREEVPKRLDSLENFRSEAIGSFRMTKTVGGIICTILAIVQICIILV